jgi:hypothetical protein
VRPIPRIDPQCAQALSGNHPRGRDYRLRGRMSRPLGAGRGALPPFIHESVRTPPMFRSFGGRGCRWSRSPECAIRSALGSPAFALPGASPFPGRRRAGRPVVCVVRQVFRTQCEALSAVTFPCLGSTVRGNALTVAVDGVAPRLLDSEQFLRHDGPHRRLVDHASCKAGHQKSVVTVGIKTTAPHGGS